MPEQPTRTSRPNLSVAIVGVVLGLVYLVIGIATGQTGFGVAGLVIMLAYAGLMYGLRRRSEPAQLLSGNVTDERQVLVTQRALAFSGQVLITAVVLGFLVCLSLRSSYTPVFSGLAALGGLSFMAGVVWNSRRG